MSYIFTDDVKTKYLDGMVSIHELPSRSYYENKLLPMVIDKKPVLDIGVRNYTLQYREILSPDYFTADIELSDKVEKLDFKFDVSCPMFPSIVEKQNILFNSILFMGVIGVGINYHHQIKMTFANMNRILVDDGIVIVGWPEYPDKFLRYEINQQYYGQSVEEKFIIPIVQTCGFDVVPLESQQVYRGNGLWDNEQKYQAYMILKKNRRICHSCISKQYDWMNYVSKRNHL